ncbi:hypothetical protein DFH06DRAFT_1127520 [Mycena polygramma]|nr:hypothetical protein DFH06DRAFT_1127520 [Mycena polygramma]
MAAMRADEAGWRDGQKTRTPRDKKKTDLGLVVAAENERKVHGERLRNECQGGRLGRGSFENYFESEKSDNAGISLVCRDRNRGTLPKAGDEGDTLRSKLTSSGFRVRPAAKHKKTKMGCKSTQGTRPGGCGRGASRRLTVRSTWMFYAVRASHGPLASSSIEPDCQNLRTGAIESLQSTGKDTIRSRAPQDVQRETFAAKQETASGFWTSFEQPTMPKSLPSRILPSRIGRRVLEVQEIYRQKPLLLKLGNRCPLSDSR